MRTISIMSRSGSPVDFVVTGKSKLKTNGKTYYTGHFTWDAAASFKFEVSDIKARQLKDDDWEVQTIADDEL